MRAFLFTLILFFARASFAALMGVTSSNYAFQVRIESNPTLKQFLLNKSDPSPEVLLEIFKFVLETNEQKSKSNEGITRLMKQAEEVSQRIERLSPEFRKTLDPMLAALLERYPNREKHEILVRIINHHWLWGPSQLPYMAYQIRNGRAQMVAEATMWVLENATPEERESFFAARPISTEKTSNPTTWFAHALSLKYGARADEKKLKQALSVVNRDTLRPAPTAFTVDGQALPTSLDLYDETLSRLNDPCRSLQ